jgi:hypothetical protein
VQPCGHRYSSDNKKNCYFLPIRKQIDYYIRYRCIAHEKRDEDPNFRGDVNTEKMLLRNDGSINYFTITFQLNLDGASCFKVFWFSFT